MENSKKLRLKNHIKALNKSYENIISILNQDLEEDGDGDSDVRGDKVKIFSQGIDDASSTAENLLIKIEKKEKELEGLKNPEKEAKDKGNDEGLNSYLK